jgi:hypothetical protein
VDSPAVALALFLGVGAWVRAFGIRWSGVWVLGEEQLRYDPGDSRVC